MINSIIVITISLYFLFWFILNTILKNAGLIDIAWGLGFVLLGFTQYALYPSLLGLIPVSLVSIWGIRLAYHIGKRNINQEEDHRYQQFRRDWDRQYLIRSIFQIYGLQAVLMLLVSTSFLDGIKQAHLNSVLLLSIGLIMYGIGLYFEIVSDAQMRRFKSNPQHKGHLMTSGLWSLSRHPNYFGEATLWLGIALISLSLGSNLFALIGALVIFVLVRYVSGTPLMEKRIQTYQEFSDYAKRVPVFFPHLKGGVK